MRLLLLHPPLLSPVVWRRLEPQLRQAGHEPVAPALQWSDDTRWWAGARDVVVGQVGDAAGVLAHSGAGALLPAVLAALPSARAAVLVDAVLPPSHGSLTPPATLRDFVAALAVGGVLPPWPAWWGPGAMAGLVPDALDRADLEAQAPRLPQEFFDVPVPVPAWWEPAVRGYLRLSAAYDDEASRRWAAAPPCGRGRPGDRRPGPPGRRIEVTRRPADISGVTPDRDPAPLRLLRPETDGLPPAETVRRRRAVQGLALLALAASAGYLLWRVTSSMSGTSLWLSVPLLLLEIHAVVGLVLFTHDLWDVDVRPVPDSGGDGLVDVSSLRVAVLVPTYDEPRSILLPTVAAAVATRHPHETWVLDDGDRPWVREMAAELGARYRSRRNGADAKAGNINEALPEVDADVVAVVDADHVVSERFLEALLPYFADPGVAVVQSPQEFYNDSSFEHSARRDGRVYAEQELFYRGLLAGRNRWGAAFWCGTNAAVRVSALESVGGVATDSVTEDIQTTLRMHRKGWRTVHHNEVLAYGLAADDPRAFFIQRSRWGAGAMQVLHTDNPVVGRGLSLHQRLSYASTLFGWFDSWRTVGYVLLPVLTVLTGAMPIAAPWREFLAVFLVTFVLQRVALKVLSRGRAPLLLATYFEFVRLPASFVATMHLFGSGPSRFQVTPKAPSEDRRRNAPPALLAALMAVTVVAGTYYVLTVAGLTWTSYEVPWVAHGAALWLAVNGVFVVAATARIRRIEFSGNRRSAWRFGTDTEVELVADGPDEGPRRARLADVSIGGARLVLSDGYLGMAGLAPGARTDLRLPVSGPDGSSLVVPATTRAVWPGEVEGTWNVGVHFDISTLEAGELALALYRTPAPAVVPTTGLVPAPRRPSPAEQGQLQEG